MIPHLYVPLLEPEDVVRHLGSQEQHWKAGRSAHALTVLWSKSAGFPRAIQAALTKHPVFKSAVLIDAFLERKVDLGSAGRPSQTDLLAIVGLDQGIATIAVEGKAGEPFDEYVDVWLRGKSKSGEEGRKGREHRLERFCETFELSREAALPLRYQLLHRSACAIYEAKRYRTKVAAFLVHSFSKDPRGFADFSAFLQALGLEPPAQGELVGPIKRDGVSLYAGWIADEPPSDDVPYLDSLRDYADRLTRDCDRFRAWCEEQKSKL